jgi:hypothetical protein
MLILLGTSSLTYTLLRTTCAGPTAPHVLFSLACGVIAAGVLSFFTLLS